MLLRPAGRECCSKLGYVVSQGSFIKKQGAGADTFIKPDKAELEYLSSIPQMLLPPQVSKEYREVATGSGDL